MKKDLYIKIVLSVIAISLVLITVKFVWPGVFKVHYSSRLEEWRANR